MFSTGIVMISSLMDSMMAGIFGEEIKFKKGDSVIICCNDKTGGGRYKIGDKGIVNENGSFMPWVILALSRKKVPIYQNNLKKNVLKEIAEEALKEK